MILLFVTIFFIVLTGFITMIYYSKTNKRHKERLNIAENFLNEYGPISKCVKQSYLIICQRRYEHIMTFFNFQLINKVFGFLSVVFSLLSFSSYTLEALAISNDLSSLLVSFLSIVCVIIALYASPNRRVVDYINAWRVDEKIVNEITANFENILNQDEIEQSKIMQEYLEQLSIAEQNIKSDED
ncbi:hypothetical protein [Eubacterium sp.]|uniref:hypothetical protein n=1 Tax=Eubacterium sp. TaxID=142586 RepID=UPI003993F7D6